MASLTRWSQSVLRRTLGTFITTTISAAIGVGVVDGTGLIDVGDTGLDLLSYHLWLAAVATGLVAAITGTLLPAVSKLGTRLSQTPEEELDLP